MLKKIISGGQTGADRAGLEVAKELGIATGGVAPKGYLTENGPDPSLADFGLIEDGSEDYVIRTMRNVKMSDGTVIFGDMKSSGSLTTKLFCEKMKNPFLVNPEGSDLMDWILSNKIETLNVAGNRASKNPGIAKVVRQTFMDAFETDPDLKARTHQIEMRLNGN